MASAAANQLSTCGPEGWKPGAISFRWTTRGARDAVVHCSHHHRGWGYLHSGQHNSETVQCLCFKTSELWLKHWLVSPHFKRFFKMATLVEDFIFIIFNSLAMKIVLLHKHHFLIGHSPQCGFFGAETKKPLLLLSAMPGRVASTSPTTASSVFFAKSSTGSTLTTRTTLAV